MAVGAEGLLAGTVGGGAPERRMIAHLVAGLGRGDLTPGEVRLTHRAQAEMASGLVCGGEQWVAWAPLSRLDQVRAVVTALATGQRISWTIGPAGWALADAATASGEHLLLSGPSHEVWVIGGGHVGRALTRVLAGLDFWVVVADERPEVALSNPWAHRRVPVPFAEVGRVVPPGERTFVAIVTAAVESDAAALDALWDIPLGYLGVMGSRAKLAQLLAGRGKRPAWLHAPMGVPIGSHTPAEIAVSVAAELVAVRQGRDRR